jgi:type IV pilus assembly protein PilB
MKRIGELLMDAGLISRTQLEIALKKQETMDTRKRLGEILVDEGYLSLDVLIRYLEAQMVAPSRYKTRP